jgi:two-component system NtrC family sensor kinase
MWTKALHLNGGRIRAKIPWPCVGAVRVPIATKLVLGFLFIIFLTSLIFSVVGVRIIGDRVVAEAQEKVRTDLNSAREIYLNHLAHIQDEVRFVADRTFVRDGSAFSSRAKLLEKLAPIGAREKLDVLTITGPSGVVLLRTTNPDLAGDDQSADPLVREVLRRKEPVSATLVVRAEELRRESPGLAQRAYFRFIPTPRAKARPEQEETSGLMLKAAAPIFDFANNFIGVTYGGVLLNRNFEIVDKIKQTVFQGLKYEGKDIGTATIFLDDLRISTNVENEDGSRAIGTRVAEDVYDQVVKQGQPWIGRAYVVNHWYITAYEPIRDLSQGIVGILYVGILEQKYLDIRRRAVGVFLAITLLGALVALALSYFFARNISVSVNKLVTASREVAHGNLDAQVEIRSKDELHELADTFNFMASALKRRDEQLKEFATRKIMESERLALIGQLAAGVAHEINNPLQGIVTYSHLLLEGMPEPGRHREAVQKIVTQADRCRDIIRGLLDFSRQRKPDKRLFDVNVVLQECVSLVANQALFHNIEIVQNLAEPLPRLLMDPSQIQQVFMNLIINAAEAMNGAGRLTLRTRFDPCAQVVEAQFTDTGHGIRLEDKERIFDPFFTTKEVGHGTGLGLAISYGIIKEHNGMVTVESEAGRGATFTVRLPVTNEEGA